MDLAALLKLGNREVETTSDREPKEAAENLRLRASEAPPDSNLRTIAGAEGKAEQHQNGTGL